MLRAACGRMLPGPSLSRLGPCTAPRLLASQRARIVPVQAVAPRSYAATAPRPPSKKSSRGTRPSSDPGHASSGNLDPPSPSLLGTAWSLTIKVACAAPIALFVVYHVVSLAQVQGGSMRPTLNAEVTELGTKHAGDIVVLNKWTPGMRKYTVGDVVTMTDPDNPSLELTKRILALEDDVVAVHGVGPSSDQRILAAIVDHKENDRSTVYVRIPPGHAWVEGDASILDLHPMGPAQHIQSRDSRTYGPVCAHSTALHRSRDWQLMFEYTPSSTPPPPPPKKKVPLGLVNARIDWVLWPPRRFGRPGKRPGLRMPQIPDSVAYGPSTATQRTRQDLIGGNKSQLAEARSREEAEDKALAILSARR